MSLPFDAIHRVAVLTDDARAAAERYSRFFGVREWALRERTARALDGDADLAYQSAVGRAGPVQFELITPRRADDALGQRFAERGPGIAHVVVEVPDPGALAPVMHGLRLPAQRYELPEGLLVTTAGAALPGGLGLHYVPAAALPAADEVLRFAHEAVLPVQRLYQVALIVRDLPAARARFEAALGITAWVEIPLATGPGMPDSVYYGRPVEHAARIAIGRRGDACIELIEPLSGPTVYRDALQRHGETPHHVMTTICPPAQFDAAVAALAPGGIVVAQSASIPTLMRFSYLDGSGVLDGLFVEVINPLSEDWLARMFPDPALARIVTGG